MNRPPVSLGLIGAGRWGRAYIHTLRNLEGVELTRLCSGNPESAAWVGPRCEITRDWRALVKADGLDGVIIATPPAFHAEMVEAAVRAAKPVLVEKPLTLSLDDALRVQEVVEQSGAPVLVDHTHLFHPGYVVLKERAGELGPVRFIDSAGGNRGPFRPDVSALWDYGPHDIALCLDLLGEAPASVGAERRLAGDTEEGCGEVLSLRLGFPGGVAAAITIGNLMPQKRRRFAVYFDDSVLVLDDLAEHKLMMHRFKWMSPVDLGDRDLGPGLPVPVPADLPLTRVVRTFIDGLRGGSRESFGVGLGVQVVRVLSECQSLLVRLVEPRAVAAEGSSG